MKAQKVIQSPIARKMYDLKLQHAVEILSGNAKNARKTYKDFAKLAVHNFEVAMSVPSPIEGRFSIFSKKGFNCLKYLIYCLFTQKTLEEKQLKKMTNEFKAKQELLK